MKCLRFTPLFVLALSLIFFSCKKEDVEDPVGSAGGGGGGSSSAPKGFTAEINGADWTANTVSALIDNGTVNISGSNGQGEFELIIYQEGAGSYLSPSLACSLFYTPAGGSQEVMEGQIVITAINTNANIISGEFSGEASGGAQILNGVFTSIPYTGTYTAAGIPLTQEGELLVDGSNFNPDLITGNAGFGKIALNLARTSDDRSVGLKLNENIAAGTFDLNATEFESANYNLSGDLSDQFYASTANLKVIAHNTQNAYIMAEFNFQAGAFSITNGLLKISY